MHTKESLYKWEEINGEDVILDGPYQLSKEDEVELFHSIIDKFPFVDEVNPRPKSLVELLILVLAEFDYSDKAKFEILEIYAEHLNLKGYEEPL